jgi:hypothetical protein
LLQCDLIDNREVSNVEGRDLAKSFGVPFFESSAKSRINVEEAFYELVRYFFCCSACAMRWSFVASCRRRFLQVREIRRQTVAKPSATASAAKPAAKPKSKCSVL